MVRKRVLRGRSEGTTSGVNMFLDERLTSYMKKDYLVLLNKLDGNLASDISTRCTSQMLWSFSGESQAIISTINKL